MSSFNEREKGYEKQFEHDQELAFKAHARRDKLFGLWVADRLGLTGDEAAAYARSIVEADLGKSGLDSILHKITADLDAKGKSATPEQLHAELKIFDTQAKKEIAEGR